MPRRFKSTILLVSLVVSLWPNASYGRTAPDKFVRTANYFLMSGTTLENPATIESLASYDLLVIPVEAQVYNVPFFSEVRRQNPDIMILAYVPTVSFNDLYWSDSLHQQLKRGIASDWWLKDGSENQVSIWSGTSALNLNSGWTDYLATFAQQKIYATGLWDGIFFDEVQDSIDWVGAVDTDRDGQADTASTANANWEKGFQNLFSKARAALGTSATIIINGSSNADFQSSVNGRMFESFPTPWEGDGKWATVMQHYLDLESDVGYDPTFILNADTGNTGTSTDFKDVRFGLASTLLGDGYFGYDYGTSSHAQLWQYDEYDAYLGEPKGDPEDVLNPTNETMKKSVWERDFENGKVIVNATDAAQTVRLDGEYEKLHGTQDATVNNGSFVTQVSVGAQDGLLLLRPIEEIFDATYVNGSFVRIFSSKGETKRTGFFAYDSDVRGGERVLAYDTDTDGKRETIVAGDSLVEIYDDDGTLHASFYPYTSAFKLGVNIAAGDLEGDGTVEIVTGTENGGGPQIRIFNKDGVLINPGFFAYDTAFRGGVNVAIGDLNGDGTREVIAGAGVGGGPHVRVCNKDGKVINPGFFAYDEKFRGGVNVAAGDVDGDGIDDIVAGPGAGGGPHVRVFDRDGNLKSQFFAFDENERKGVEVMATDLDGDGLAEIVGMSSEVFTFSSY